MMEKMEITPEGWVVTDLKTFRLIADNRPPRPYGYLDQLWIDCTSWKPIVMWAIGAGSIGVAIAFGWWPFLVLGGALFAWWFSMFRNTVRYIRDSPMGGGVVEVLEPHPLMRDCSTGIALTAEGREVPVAFPTRLAEGIIGEGRRAEVLFLHDPRSEFSLGFGVRAAPTDGNR